MDLERMNALEIREMVFAAKMELVDRLSKMSGEPIKRAVETGGSLGIFGYDGKSDGSYKRYVHVVPDPEDLDELDIDSLALMYEWCRPSNPIGWVKKEISKITDLPEDMREKIRDWHKDLLDKNVSEIIGAMKGWSETTGDNGDLLEILENILEPVKDIVIEDLKKPISEMTTVGELYDAFLYWHYEGSEGFLIN